MHVATSRTTAYPGDVVLFSITAANADGSGRTGAAAMLRVDVYGPTNTLLTTGTPTEITTPVATGAYRFTFSLGASPTVGSYLVVVRTTDVVPASASTAFNVAATPPATAPQAQAILTLLQRLDANLTALDLDAQAHHDALLAHRGLSPEYTAEEAQESWLETIGQLAWVIWGLYFVASRFVHPTLLRVLVDLVGFGLLALPIPAGQVEILFFAPLAATGWDAFRYAEENL